MVVQQVVGKDLLIYLFRDVDGSMFGRFFFKHSENSLVKPSLILGDKMLKARS